MDHQVALRQQLRRELEAHLSRRRGLRGLIEASEAEAGRGTSGARGRHRRSPTFALVVYHVRLRGQTRVARRTDILESSVSFPTGVPSDVAAVVVEHPLVQHVHREASGEADVGLEQPAAQVLLMDEPRLLPMLSKGWG